MANPGVHIASNAISLFEYVLICLLIEHPVSRYT